MSGILGGGGKAVKAPPVPPPPAIPVVGEEVGDIARRKRPRGRRKTFLTGELVPDTGLKQRLS